MPTWRTMLPPIATGGFDPTRIFSGRRGQEYVGLEIECALVDPETGLAAPVYGPRSSVATLHKWAGSFGHADGTPSHDAVAVRHRAGGSVSLELGGAIEYASPPAKRVVDVVAGARATLRELSTTARSLDLALITGGLSPFSGASSIHWIDKPRIGLMRRHFDALGENGMRGSHVMGLSMAIQTTLDYADPDDLSRKAYVAVGASPFLAALFANSPIAGGEVSQFLSERMRYWESVDPVRCAFQDYILTAGPSAGKGLVDALVERLINMPSIYHRSDDRASHLGDGIRTSGSVMADDPASADQDWRLHLSQVWPQVRIRDTVELRAFDSPPWPAIGAAPALWAGLLYDGRSLADAIDLLSHFSVDELAGLSWRVARDGLRATLSGSTVVVGDASCELLNIAEAGLRRRIQRGLESASALQLIEPIRIVAQSRRTFAEDVRDNWLGVLDKSPSRFVEAYRIPPT